MSSQNIYQKITLGSFVCIFIVFQVFVVHLHAVCCAVRKKNYRPGLQV